MISVFFYIPVSWARTKEKIIPAFTVSVSFLTLLLALSGVFFPHSNISLPGPEAEEGRFYGSGENLLFVNNLEKGKLTGLSIEKKGESLPAQPRVVYNKKYFITEKLHLKIDDNKNEYIAGNINPYSNFFKSLVKYSSFIAESIGKSGVSDPAGLLIKTASVVITACAISFFFSAGRWPLVNYLFSQFFVFFFIWLNYHAHRLPVPAFLSSFSQTFKAEATIYYFAYLIISTAAIILMLTARVLRK